MLCLELYCGLEYAPNPLSAGAAPQTPLGNLAAFKGPTSKGRGGDEREREGKGGEGERGGKHVSGGEREGR